MDWRLSAGLGMCYDNEALLLLLLLLLLSWNVVSRVVAVSFHVPPFFTPF